MALVELAAFGIAVVLGLLIAAAFYLVLAIELIRMIGEWLAKKWRN